MRLRAIGPVLLIVVLLGVACGDDPPSPTPTSAAFATPEVDATGPSLTPDAEPEETPEPTPGLPPVDLTGVRYSDLRVGPALEFPENTALIVEVGCTSCDAPASGLKRLYRNKGTVHVDELFSRPEQIDGEDVVYITSEAVSQDGSTLVVAVCVNKYCGGLGFPVPGAAAMFHVSRDGGVTWTQEPRSEEALRIFAITPQGWITGRWWNDAFIWVGGVRTPQPAGATGVLYSARTSGSLRWAAGNRVLNADGSELVRVDQAENVGLVLQAPGQTPIVGWYPPAQQVGYMLTRQQPSGDHVGFRYSGYLLSTVMIDSERFFADIDDPASPIGRTPAIVDFARGVINPITGVSALLRSGRTSAVATYQGPFLRVEAGGECLNVYERADEVSAAVECLASRVLVRDLLQSAGGGGKNWSQVELLDGRQGWAETQYLKAD